MHLYSTQVTLSHRFSASVGAVANRLTRGGAVFKH